mmetsp:Transcript_12486/g.20333  ORF Transcript_12486/g.20333 Transcript_12486/m.20333 type:complete len:203 (-) Transcript_12486:54-662(-)
MKAKGSPSASSTTTVMLSKERKCDMESKSTGLEANGRSLSRGVSQRSNGLWSFWWISLISLRETPRQKKARNNSDSRRRHSRGAEQDGGSRDFIDRSPLTLLIRMRRTTTRRTIKTITRTRPVRRRKERPLFLSEQGSPLAVAARDSIPLAAADPLQEVVLVEEEEASHIHLPPHPVAENNISPPPPPPPDLPLPLLLHQHM